jgi:hypothetical protein
MKNPEENQNEFARWINLSVKFGHYKTFLMPIIQGLGKFSLQLDVIDQKILRGMHGQKRATIEFSSLSTDAFMRSHLWVLGAYEAIRTLHQLAETEKTEKTETEEKLIEEIKITKYLFEEIRVPLAKMEVPRRNKSNLDISAIAYPVLDMKRGVAWHLGKDKFISRKELSDALLDLAKYF